MVILARSTSFIMTKISLQGVDVFTLLSLRFILAFLFLLPFGWRKLKNVSLVTIRRGMLLGLMFFSVMTAEVSSLKTTNASTVALLENTAIVFVPLIEAILSKKLPKSTVIISSLMAFMGVMMITMKGYSFAFNLGEGLAVVAAVLYAISIISTDRISRKEYPITIGIIQVASMGLYSLLGALIFETPKLPVTILDWQMIVTLAIVCTGFGFTLQPLAQSRTTSERAALFCALSPASAAILSFVILKEQFDLYRVIGILLILFGMIVTNLLDMFKKEVENIEISEDNRRIETERI